ncbi:MAG: hypothetical protein A3G23_04715 [Bacteroidetes bacterium RIFCSPLOWO2_12_FULL_37_12]|nr:MAG: hypothetical protein A3G23_04715 [Bacteroidetes bacterium RIFCSPLOWO2_12_FULL_37_12]
MSPSFTKSIVFFIHSILIILFIHQNSFSQKGGLKLKKHTELSVQNKDSSRFYSPNLLAFTNLNKIPYHYSLKKLSAIQKAQEKHDIKKIHYMLNDYVLSFGIMNFVKDIDLVWKLGQLEEQSGNMEKAKELYRIALRHQPDKKNRIIQQYYDSLIAYEKDNYVPLDYYYELVEYRKAIDTMRPPRGVFINMGEEINSEFPDYAPAMNAANDRLVFTSKRNVDAVSNRVNEDLYLSLKEDAFWEPSVPFPGDINSQKNEGSAFLNKDGTLLYFVRCDASDGLGNCDIYSARFANGKWVDIKNLGENVNSLAWDSHPSLSPDENTLYFSSDRYGGFGGSDIYMTTRNKKGKWGKAENLGPVINTPGKELSPFYHPVYEVLYFSSNGQLLNFGNLDIYKSYRATNGWKEPMNIGPLVNGDGEEYYFTIDKKADFLYYARSEYSDQNLDIYSFPLPMEARPNATTILEGKLVDSTNNKSMRGIITIIDVTNNIEVAPRYLRSDGSFSFNLINKAKYKILIQGDDFFSVEKEIMVDGDTIIALLSKIVDVDKPIVFQAIDFKVNSSDISPEMIQSLYYIMTFLLDNPTYKLTISGHTDSDGDQEINAELSFKRANAIKDYLVEKGHIESRRVSAQGFGSSKPIVSNDTEENKRKNRRVEFDIVKDWQK